MQRKTDLEYLQLNKFRKLIYNLLLFFSLIPTYILNFLKKCWTKIKKFGIAIKDMFVDIGHTWKVGSWKTRVSFFIMGFGNLARKQILKGLLFFIFEAVFIFYMIVAGGHWLSKFPSLGTQATYQEYDPIYDTYVEKRGDQSFQILLYGILTIAFIIALIYTWRLNVKQNKINDEIIASGKKIKSDKDDLRSLIDNDFHKTLLALPIAGIMIFTVLPVVFMICVAFTNYDVENNGYTNLFTWVGLDNFNAIFTVGIGPDKNLKAAFGEILGWTLMWAFFATFTNYFLGMGVAMLINKKGIRFKKMWRGILVLTIAIPQFISLVYVSNMFAREGLVNNILYKYGLVEMDTLIPFWEDKTLSRVMVILINIWIGIPYLVLITTGVLMNIPQDLYESAKIDGANVWQQYTRITLPYMLFVTGPYLLTSFIGNINNFNVIFLLTGGGPTNEALSTSGGAAGDTDLLITWLYNITTGASNNYKLASVIGIMIFAVVSILSLIVYNIIPSTRNEEDYS